MIVLFTLGLIILLTSIGDAEPTYVGAKKCKMCHLTEYKSWEKTKHAGVFDLLKDDEKKDAKCIKCHVTGSVDNPGVQCEACHGPGSDYKKKTIMKDHEAREKAGLIAKPDEKVCTKCHNKESPTFKEFKFEERIKNTQAIHEKKKAK